MSLLHRMRLWDKVTGYFASINASGEQLVNDADANLQLIDIETAIDNVEENQTDKTQMTNITDGTNESAVRYNDQESEGELSVNLRGHVCTDNSTSTPLVNAGVFDGDWQDTLDYGIIAIGVNADQDSATDGLVIQWSSNASTVHDTDVFSILANKGKIFTFGPARRYVKLVYTNGGVTQLSFNLETTLRRVYMKPSSHRIQDSIVGEDDAELVKSVLTGVDPDNTYRNVNVTADGDMTISDNSSGLAIAKGDVTGSSFVSKFGQNEAVGTAAYEDIWDGGGTYTYPADSTAPVTHIYSTGVDVQPIEVQGLDVNGELVVQTKTLTGTTVVALDTALWRVFRMKNTGTSDILTGSIVHASDVGKAVSYAQIVNGNNQTLMALYTVPAGYTGYLVMGGASLVGLNRAYSMDGHFYMRSFGGVFQLKHTFGVNSEGTSTFQHEYKIPLPIAEKTDLRVRAISSAAGGVLNATFDIVLVEN